MAGRTIVYVDGFNLYYSIRRTPYRWLDPLALARTLLPSDTIVALKYFTAAVKPQPDDPNARTRQSVYLRALATLHPTVTVHHGRFLRNKNRMPLTWKPKSRWERWLLAKAVRDPKIVERPLGTTPTIRVWRTEEKGSDVNLASHLLIDGFKQDYDLAVVVSNDGDLEFPVRYVREDLGIPVGVLDARLHRNKALSPDILPAGSFYKRIRLGSLGKSQFPLQMSDAKGSFHRPEEWAVGKSRP